MDFTQCWWDYAVGMWTGGEQEALEGFIGGFIAEFESGVVDGEDAGSL